MRTIVIECMKKVLNSENQVCISDGARFIEDLGFDSLQFVEFLGSLEEEFGFVIPDSDFTIDTFDNLDKVIQYLARRSTKIVWCVPVAVADNANIV